MKSSFAFLRQHVLPVVLCFAAIFGIAALTDTFEKQDNLLRDPLTVYRAKLRDEPAPADIGLVGMDLQSLSDFGSWPWPRSVHGDFLQLIGQAKPSVVAWDILFVEKNPEDEALKQGLLAGGGTSIFGASRATKEEGGIRPDDPVAKASRLQAIARVEGDRSRLATDEAMLLPTGELSSLVHIGFVDTPPESDGVRRRAPLVVQIGDQVYPTLSLRSLMEYWQATPDQVRVVLGEAIYLDAPLAKRRIPIDAHGAFRINYRHALEGYQSYGYSHLMAGLYDRFVEKKAVEIPPLTGRLLLVGQVAEGLSDLGPTPFSPLTPLVLVHANVIENIMKEDYVKFVPAWAIWLGGILLGIAGMARFSDRKLRQQAVFSIGIPIAYAMVAAFLWMDGSWLMPVTAPLSAFGLVQLLMIGRRVIAEQKAKEQIKGMFGTYVSPQLVSRMVASGEMPQLGGHEEQITAYFSDIQGFSTFSEILPPHRLVELMNEYLTACTDIVQEEGGTLDKYIGDAVVAMFGAPIALPDHAYRACVATQRVQLRLAELREKWKGEGDKWPEIVWKMQSRIGLNSGSAVVGNMGSRTRFNYTMMGDSVNLAARMESGAKSWGAYVMCTEMTKQSCEQHGDRVVFRPLGRIVVKGRTIAVPIFEIVGLKENVSSQTRECIGLFTQAMEKYYARDWDGALKLFAASRDLEINVPGKTPGVTSNPSLIYLDITEHFKAEPPPANWEGVYVMKEK